ncbi:dihydrofolate reductase family protein [Sneathiella marina]|uniref:Dihydrofolate reductase family protein n=1 Tax=Sneathiella marina TaxID=2950108 RepID=A0ABY4W7Q5_9PROT|nr:dihydrofolate reductase family protein [Sneathiella marina]USG62881.1 dihydrofolate reductase family protein [Sneathiella marina]
MITAHIYIAVSLDGFIAREDGDLDWLMKQAVEGEEHGYDAFMDTIDGIVMGRNSYEKVLTFGDWPYKKPVVVLSRSMSPADIPAELADRVSVSSKTPEGVLTELAEIGWRSVYVDGGQIIQAFLRAGLVKDMLLTRIPILLGTGIPLFGPLEQDIDLHHMETVPYPSGLVSSKYEILKKT